MTTLAPIRAALEEGVRQVDVLEAAGVNARPLDTMVENRRVNHAATQPR